MQAISDRQSRAPSALNIKEEPKQQLQVVNAVAAAIIFGLLGAGIGYILSGSIAGAIAGSCLVVSLIAIIAVVVKRSEPIILKMKDTENELVVKSGKRRRRTATSKRPLSYFSEGESHPVLRVEVKSPSAEKPQEASDITPINTPRLETPTDSSFSRDSPKDGDAIMALIEDDQDTSDVEDCYTSGLSDFEDVGEGLCTDSDENSHSAASEAIRNVADILELQASQVQGALNDFFWTK